MHRVGLVCLVAILFACTGRKAEECQSLARGINAIRLELPETDDQTALRTLADQAHQAAAGLAQIKLGDPRLLALRERYQKAADGYSTEVRAMAEHLGELSTASADGGLRRVIRERTTERHHAARQYAQETSSVAQELNAYCSDR